MLANQTKSRRQASKRPAAKVRKERLRHSQTAWQQWRTERASGQRPVLPNVAFCTYEKLAVFLLLPPLSPAFLLLFLAFLLLLPFCTYKKLVTSSLFALVAFLLLVLALPALAALCRLSRFRWETSCLFSCLLAFVSRLLALAARC